MSKRLFLILLSVFSLSVFSRNGQGSVSKVDSSFFYTEKANYFKNNKVFDKALENAHKSIVFGQKTN